MKKFISFLTVLGLIFSMNGFCFASGPIVESQTISMETLEDGTTVETILTIYKNPSRSQDKNASVTKNYTGPGNEKAASITLYASFSYDGSRAWSDYAYSDVTEYNRWGYENENINYGGSTATLSARLTKSGESSKSVSMYIKCSSNGEITSN